MRRSAEPQDQRVLRQILSSNSGIEAVRPGVPSGFSNGTWIGSASFGRSLGFDISRYPVTTTTATGSGCGCK